MYPDVEGVDFRLGGFRRFVTVIVMVVMVMAMVVMVVMVVSVVVMMMMVSGFLVGLLRVLKTGTFIMMVMMVVVVLVQMLIFIHFVGLFRVLKTGTLIVVVMMSMVIVVMVVQVPPGERRQGHPQHHQEQSEGNVNPDIFRVRFLAYGGDGASPPHLGVIHLTTRRNEKGKSTIPSWSFHDGAPEPEKIFTRHD